MTGTTDIQIKKAFEEEQMTPDQIAQDLGFDVVAVKSKLMQISSTYRKACGIEDPEKSELNFSDEQLQTVNDVIYNLAIGAEDEHLRFKAASYVRDDKKGRKEVVKAVGGNTFNVLTFNEMLSGAREKMSQQMGKLVKI